MNRYNPDKPSMRGVGTRQHKFRRISPRPRYSNNQRRYEKENSLIDDLLIEYLNVEIKDKIKKRKDLEDTIRRYLFIVPPDKKFYFTQIAEVLRRSVEESKNFSLCQTMDGLSALASYAENLYSQPWRKEFLEIRTYSGFFKHKVESSLVGGETVLQLLGYNKPNKNGSMINSGRIDTNTILHVLHDLFVALGECRIMSTIMENIIRLNEGRDYSYVYILRYRERNAGSADDSTRGILSLMHQYYMDYQKYYVSQSSGNPSPYSYNHAQINNPNQYYGPYPSYVPTPTMGVYHQILPGNSYYGSSSNYEPTSSNRYSCSVPTGNLIELDSCHPPNISAHRRTVSDSRQWNCEGYPYAKSDSYDSKANLYKNTNPTLPKVGHTAKMFESMSISGPVEPSCSKPQTCSRKKTKDCYSVDSIGQRSVTKTKSSELNDHYDLTDSEKYRQSKTVLSQAEKKNDDKNHRRSTSPGEKKKICPRCSLPTKINTQHCEVCDSKFDNSYSPHKY